MKKSHSGFTFVELIVVLVIITILSTIGFVTYESYLGTGRDTVKISLLKDIYSSFGTYSLKSRIPLPANRVDITASGTLFAYQGDFTQEVADTIGFKGNPYDDNLEIFPSYILLKNQKDSQILHYLEDKQSIQQTLISQSYAFTDYQQLVPKIIGKALGIMMHSETKEPLHLIDSVSAFGSYDVVTGTGELRAYYSQREYYEDNISRIIPNKSCLRVLELGGSKGNGIYTINPTGSSKIRVHCDMLIDGGGWSKVINFKRGDITWNAYIIDEGTYDFSKNSTYGFAINQFSSDINGEDLEYMFFVDGIQEGPIYSNTDYRIWDPDMGATRFDTSIDQKNPNSGIITNCLMNNGLYHATASWNWSISSASGTGCGGYTSGGGFILLDSSNIGGRLYGLNKYTASTDWENLEIFVR